MSILDKRMDLAGHEINPGQEAQRTMALILVTTPHGRRPYSLALMETQITAQSCPAETIAHKWQVLDDIRKAKDVLGVSDRPVALLNALLSFHQETTLTGGE